ncbi:EAL domain-containing protein [Oricola sp.]|uniref:EAL domain-containing protein n=1 Tax=Oricola sp. TaxID=1979950 RepID=UPI003BAC1535
MAPLQIETLDDGDIVARHDGLILRTAFQPIFRYTAGRLAPIACEALLRVYRDETPVLTESWFNEIGIDALREIEPQLFRLHIRSARHLPPDMRRLFLNIDPRVSDDTAAFDTSLRILGEELRAADISPSDIVCEITEAENADAAALTRFVYELRARGYRIAVDDFGAHASRLARIGTLAPDIVKFDAKLVRRLLSTRAGTGTLAALTARFSGDGIESIFEGIEALWEIEAAEYAGAGMVQGYVLAAPRLAGAGLARWLDQYRAADIEPTGQMVKRFR